MELQLNRIIYILFFFFVFTPNTYSQDRKQGKFHLTYYNVYIKNNSPHDLCTKAHNRSYIKISIIYSSGKSEQVYKADYEELPDSKEQRQIGNDGYIINQDFYTYDLPSNVVISSARSTQDLFGCNEVYSGIDSVKLGKCIDEYHDNCHGFGGLFHLSFLPDLSIDYYNNQNKLSKDRILPFDDKIVLKAPVGYPQDVYNWEYSIDNNDNKTFYSYSKGKGADNIVISGSDLFKRFDTGVKNVCFRLNSGCNTGDTIILSNIPSAPHIQSYKVEQPHCNGDSTGKIVLKLDRKLYEREVVRLFLCEDETRGDPVNCIVGGDSIVINNVSSGKYTYKVDGTYKGYTCYSLSEKHKVTVNVSQPNAFTFYSNFYAPSQSISCYGGSDGSLTQYASGGTSPFKYSWKRENETEWNQSTLTQSSIIIPNLSAGKYMLNVSDKYGCGQSSITKEFIMPEPEKITASGSLSNATEFGVSDGSINYVITTSNNNNGRKYNYSWENSKHEILTSKETLYGGYTGTKLDNLPADTFMLTVSITQSGTNKPLPSYDTPDGAGCRSTFKVVITQPDPIVISIDTLKQVSCTGGADGRLNARVTGGVKPYTFHWENWQNTTAGTDSTMTGAVGEYTLHFADANGVKREVTAYLPQIDSLKTLLESVTKVFCKGNATGEISISAKGGTPPYAYQWSSGEKTPEVTEKTAGDYIVTVTDANQCIDTLSVAVESSENIAYELQTKDLTCYHSNDGEIEITDITGGNPPYVLEWENGDNRQTRNRLQAGYYSATITDSRQCIETVEATLTEPDTILPRVEKDVYVLCQGQEQPLDITVDNAKSYAWYNGERKVSDSRQIVITEAGSYRAEITDTDNCLGHRSFEVQTTDHEISSDFIVASSVAQDSVLRAVNITRTDFDTMEWLLDDDSDISVTEDGPYSLEVAFARQDTFRITLRTSQWGCEAITTKSIVVVDAAEVEEYKEGDVAYIQKFLVTPNPTNGEFDATIELGEAMDVSLYMYTSNSSLPLDVRHLTGEKWYKEHFSVSLVSGTYFLRLVTPNPRIYSVAKIVVK